MWLWQVGCAKFLPMSQPNDPTYNLLSIAGVQTTEIGSSVAHSFALMEKKTIDRLNVENVNIDAVHYSESISLDGAGLDNLTNFTTLDLGMVMAVTVNVRVGVTVKNLLI